jgi:KDO2-lipid IV(A) lauroyltransferase
MMQIGILGKESLPRLSWSIVRSRRAAEPSTAPVEFTERPAPIEGPSSLKWTTRLVGALPRRALEPAARKLGRLWCVLDVPRRRAVRINRQALPGRRPLWPPFAAHLTNLLEWLWMLNRGSVPTEEEVAGVERLALEIERSGGAVVATLHLGDWERAGLAMARRVGPILTVAGVQLRRGWSEAFKRWQASRGVHVLDASRDARRLVRSLGAGRPVVLHLDGDRFGAASPVRFLGRTVPFPVGPARLARLARRPVIAAYCLRRPEGRVEIRCGPTFPPPRNRRDELKLTEALARWASLTVEAHLDQWCLFRPLEASEP